MALVAGTVDQECQCVCQLSSGSQWYDRAVLTAELPQSLHNDI